MSAQAKLQQPGEGNQGLEEPLSIDPAPPRVVQMARGRQRTAAPSTCRSPSTALPQAGVERLSPVSSRVGAQR